MPATQAPATPQPKPLPQQPPPMAHPPPPLDRHILNVAKKKSIQPPLGPSLTNFVYLHNLSSHMCK
jgi:hypothetical protein